MSSAIGQLEEVIQDLKRRMALIESGQLGTNTDQPNYRVLIAKLQATEKALAIVKHPWSNQYYYVK